MAKDILGQVVRKIVDLPSEMTGVICDLAEKFSGESGKEWLAEFKKFLRKEKCWTGVVIETILNFIATITIPARTEKFIAKDNLVVDTSKNAKVKISYLGDNFRNNFLGKTEEPTPETALCQHELKRPLRDIVIINELGGEDKVETTLSAMFALMEKQPNGETGTLLANGYANIFYVRDFVDVLWMVGCRWDDDGWGVSANSVGHANGWIAGSHVFSCNS